MTSVVRGVIGVCWRGGFMEMGSVFKIETIFVLSVFVRWDFIIIVLYLFIRYIV